MSVAARLPAAYLLVPALTIATAAALLVAVASPRPLRAARLLGGPSDEGAQVLRLQCVRRLLGVDDAFALDAITVEVDGIAHPAACDASGHGEVPIDGRPGPRSLRVSRGAEVLAEGTAHVNLATWLAGATVTPTTLRTSGSLAIQARTLAPLVIGQPADVVLELPDDLRKPGALRLTPTGADLVATRESAQGLLVSLRPTFFTASLEAEEVHPSPGSAPRRWQVSLPVESSGIAVESLAVDGAEVRGRLRSLTQRVSAFVRVEDQRGRRAAATVPLTHDGRGGASGAFTLPLPRLDGPAWLVTSAGPDGPALPWPLDPVAHERRERRTVVDAQWLDGLAPMRERELKRLNERLGAVGAVVLCGGLLEALLLVRHARASRRALARHLAEAGGDELTDTPLDDTGLWRPLVAIVVVLFGFAIIGSLLLLRP